jgi:2-polyprenyl-6-methoxyphenol hydroxylase-like FAD-dependent oxidoreductase
VGADELAGDDVDADVAIVGYGPVGATLAILLAQLGRRVVVAERWPQPYPLPRAVHFDDEVGRILQACGIGPDLAAISEPGDIYEWRNGAGRTLLRYGRIGAGPSGWPASSMFNQPALEARLDARAQTLDGIVVRRGVEIDALHQSAGVVTMRGRDATGGAVEVRTRYLVGCDGARSTVRALIDAPVADLGFFYDWLIVDVVLDTPRTFDPVNLQICDPSRPTTVVSGGPGRRRWEFMRLPHESLDDLNDAGRAWELLAGWDVTPSNATIERHAVYTFAASCVEVWRDGCVLLAGEGRHLVGGVEGSTTCMAAAGGSSRSTRPRWSPVRRWRSGSRPSVVAPSSSMSPPTPGTPMPGGLPPTTRPGRCSDRTSTSMAPPPTPARHGSCWPTCTTG